MKLRKLLKSGLLWLKLDRTGSYPKLEAPRINGIKGMFFKMIPVYAKAN